VSSELNRRDIANNIGAPFPKTPRAASRGCILAGSCDYSDANRSLSRTTRPSSQSYMTFERPARCRASSPAPAVYQAAGGAL
jgi:hypothetical protein